MMHDREPFEDPAVIDRYLDLLPRVDTSYRSRLQSRLAAAPAPRRRWRWPVPWGVVPRAVPVLAAIVLVAVALLGHSRTQHTSGTTGPPPHVTISVVGFSVSNGKIAFVELLGHNGDSLDVMNLDGSGLRRLVRRGGICGAVWSPDGRQIAYVSDRTTNRKIDHYPLISMSVYVMNANGSGERRVATWGQGYITCWGESLAWSRDGTRLAFARAGFLSVLDLKTDGVRRLTAHVTGADLNPSWSPDGSSIAFAHARACGSYCSTLPYILNADGRGLRQLSAFYGDLMCGGPLWSPVGRTIAFCASRGGSHAPTWAIHAVNPDGSHPRLLVPAPPTGTNQLQVLASWSPDGRHILYIRVPWNPSKGPQATALWVMNANGSGQRRLYRVGHATIEYATWTPDGQRIVFSVLSTSSETSGLFIMHSDGSHVQRILP